MNYTVFGCGALGTILATHLVKARQKVTVVARGERYLDLTKNGLRVTGLLNFKEKCEIKNSFEKNFKTDVLIFGVKAYDLVGALDMCHNLEPKVVFSLANGIKKNQMLKEFFPNSAILGCMANFSGEILSDGTVLFTRNVSLNLDGRSSLGRSIALTIGETGLTCISDDQIESTEWSKFSGWVALFLVSIISKSKTADFLQNRQFSKMIHSIICEMSEVSTKLNIELKDDAILPVRQLAAMPVDRAMSEIVLFGENLSKHAPEHKMSSLQDLENGKILELEDTVGYVIELAKQLNVTLNVIPLLYERVKKIERSRLI